MVKRASSPLIATALLLFGFSVPAQALSNRVWVSGKGTDAPGCGSPTNACRSFQYVHDNVIAGGGEIDVLDPSGYGAINISKAISIVNGGVGTAGVQATSGNAITITAGPNDGILISGLTIEGLGLGTNGVQFNTGGSLGIANTTISGFAGTGVNFTPNDGSGANASLTIAGGGIFSNGVAGVTIAPTGGTSVRAMLEGGCDVSGSPAGVISDASGTAAGLVHTTISECFIHHINGIAVEANGPSTGGELRVMIERTALANVNTAASADGANAILALNASTIAHATTVFATSGSGGLRSSGNNGVFFYTTIGPTPGSVPLQ